MAAPDSANFCCLNFLRYLVRSYVTKPTTTRAITEIPANTPSPIGKTSTCCPGTLAAPTGVGDSDTSAPSAVPLGDVPDTTADGVGAAEAGLLSSETPADVFPSGVADATWLSAEVVVGTPLETGCETGTLGTEITSGGGGADVLGWAGLELVVETPPLLPSTELACAGTLSVEVEATVLASVLVTGALPVPLSVAILVLGSAVAVGDWLTVETTVNVVACGDSVPEETAVGVALVVGAGSRVHVLISSNAG